MQPPQRFSRSRTIIRTLAEYFVLGAFAGFFAHELGFFGVVGISNSAGGIALSAIAGAVLGLAGRGMWIVGLDLLLLAFYLVASLTPATVGTAAEWVRNDPPSASPSDAVVVLSGGITADTSLGVSGTERLLAGLELVRAGAAPRLITTHVSESIGGRTISSEAGQRRLIAMAGEDSVWSVVDSVHSTRDEATQVARLLQPVKGRSIVVVTSAIHTRRACATFEGVGFHVRCVAARGLENTTRHPVSAADRLETFRELLYERIGMLKYRWKGWISAPTTPK